MNLARLVIAALIVSGSLLQSLDAASNSEKALATRYMTLLAYGIQQSKGEERDKWLQEPLLMGAVAYYYFRSSDAKFAELLRRTAQSILSQVDASIDNEFTKFRANFIDTTVENDSMTRLRFYGFDDDTAKQILADARKDSVKSFEAWFRTKAKKNE